jgi:hypothetical protein
MTSAEYELKDEPQDYALFGIRYLLMPTAARAPSGAVYIASRGEYALWELPGNSYLQVVHTAAVIAENRGDIGAQAASFLNSALLARGEYEAVAFDGAGAGASMPGPDSTPSAAGTVLSEQAGLAQGMARATIRAPADAVVLLRASFDPGWTVTVDGVRQHPQVISPALVGVSVGPGVHTVTFRYVGFGYYGPLAVIAVGALAAAAGMDRRSRRRS